MKLCPRCNMQLEDAAAFCPNCGTQFIPNATVTQPPQMYAEPRRYVDPADHTAEFEPQDISENKIFALLPYLMGLIGIIVALLACRESKFAQFHIREALKIQICMILLILIGAIGAITIIVPIAAGICTLILYVVSIICFFRVCSGKAIEAPIVGGFGFFK